MKKGERKVERVVVVDFNPLSVTFLTRLLIKKEVIRKYNGPWIVNFFFGRVRYYKLDYESTPPFLHSASTSYYLDTENNQGATVSQT